MTSRYVWLSLPVALAQFEPAPPPAPSGGGSACAPATADAPCQHSCGSFSFDLTGFAAAHPTAPYFTANDQQQHTYYFKACGALTTLNCQSSETQQAVAIQTWGDPTPPPPNFPSDSCAALGTLSQASCTATDASGVSCDFSGGDSQRSVTFVYACDTEYKPPVASQPDISGSHYVIKFAGPAGCSGAGGGAGSGGLSWGSLTLILGLGVALPLYLGLGCYYNYKYHDARGIEMVPQLDYWKELPGLVHDGCVFSYQQTKLFIGCLRERYGSAPADPALKQALAEGEDGGATSYEEQSNKA